MELKPEPTLTNDELYRLWDITLSDYVAKPKPKDMSEKVFLAKCWEQNLLAAFKKAGYVWVKS